MTRRADLAPHALNCRCARCARPDPTRATRVAIALVLLAAILGVLCLAVVIHTGAGR